MIGKKRPTKRPVFNEVSAELRFIETAEVPSAVVWHMISRYKKEMQAVERTHQQHFNRFFGRIAMPVYYLMQLADSSEASDQSHAESATVKRIRMIESLISAVFKEEGVEIISLDGRLWRDVGKGDAESIDYIVDETIEEPFVKETCEPVVKKGDEILRPGKVIVAGPPLETENETEG